MFRRKGEERGVKLLTNDGRIYNNNRRSSIRLRGAFKILISEKQFLFFFSPIMFFFSFGKVETHLL